MRRWDSDEQWRSADYLSSSIYSTEATGYSLTGLDPTCLSEDKMKKEMVNHPDHYNAASMEVIDAIDGLGYAEGFCVGSIIKYVTRYKHKNGIEDLKKAKWYIDYLIKNYENN